MIAEDSTHLNVLFNDQFEQMKTASMAKLRMVKSFASIPLNGRNIWLLKLCMGPLGLMFPIISYWKLIPI